MWGEGMISIAQFMLDQDIDHQVDVVGPKTKSAGIYSLLRGYLCEVMSTLKAWSIALAKRRIYKVVIDILSLIKEMYETIDTLQELVKEMVASDLQLMKSNPMA